MYIIFRYEYIYIANFSLIGYQYVDPVGIPMGYDLVRTHILVLLNFYEID